MTRLDRLRQGLEAPLLVSSGTNVRYLTGLDSSNAYLLVEPERRPTIVSGGWPASAWQARATRLAETGPLDDEERAEVERAIATLGELNAMLAGAQLQVAYRTRDEVALFLLHARETPASFVTRAGEAVDPLDLAIQMKVLPRISGGSGAVRRVVPTSAFARSICAPGPTVRCTSWTCITGCFSTRCI